jgi:hypothetical protein
LAAISLALVGVSVVGSMASGTIEVVGVAAAVATSDDFADVEIGAPAIGAIRELVVVFFAVLLAGIALPASDERTTTEEPPLDADVDGLLVERVRAGPAVPSARLEVAVWLALLPALPAECDVALESDDALSVEAAAMPLPTPTAKPSPTAATRIPFRAARVLWPAARFLCRPACFL